MYSHLNQVLLAFTYGYVQPATESRTTITYACDDHDLDQKRNNKIPDGKEKHIIKLMLQHNISKHHIVMQKMLCPSLYNT